MGKGYDRVYILGSQISQDLSKPLSKGLFHRVSLQSIAGGEPRPKAGAEAWPTAQRSPKGRRPISSWALATSIPTHHCGADIRTPDWPGRARDRLTWLRTTVRALDGVDVTTQAPLRSRWTKAKSV